MVGKKIFLVFLFYALGSPFYLSQASQCDLFKENAFLHQNSLFLTELSKLASNSRLNIFSASQMSSLSQGQKKKLDKLLEKLRSDIKGKKTRGLVSHIDEIFSVLFPNRPQSPDDLAQLKYEKIVMTGALVEKLMNEGFITNYKGARKIPGLSHGTTTIVLNAAWTYLMKNFFLPLGALKIKDPLDPFSDPAIKAIYEKSKIGGFESIKKDLYHLLRQRNLFVRDPIQFEYSFNYWASIYNRKVVIGSLIALGAVKSYLEKNETAPEEKINKAVTTYEQNEDTSDEDYFRDVILKNLGIDPEKNPEEYKQAYQDYYQKDPPPKTQ